MENKNAFDINKNFADWYSNVILRAKLCSYSQVKGCINYLPYGWSVWTNIINFLDKEFKKIKIENVQLPLFIKNSEFLKEKSHLDGFLPETFVVGRSNSDSTDEQLLIRPTSEVLFSNLFKENIQSYVDLPLKYNQWCSVYRVEKNTRPFLRGSEFFWHELHAIFVSEKETKKFVSTIDKIYNKFLKNVLNIHFLYGEKTKGERFAGAIKTYTREVWSKDNQILQVGTTHYLGDTFSNVYDIKFQSNENKLLCPFSMSAGISTRLIGAIVACHGDNKGIVLPFKISPIQINIISIRVDQNNERIFVIIKKLLSKYRINIDNTDNTFGYKINESEVKGIPINLIIGPEELKKNSVTLIRRDIGEKKTVSIDGIKNVIKTEIDEYNHNLYDTSKKKLEESIVKIENLNEFKKGIIGKKIILAPWGGDENDEINLKKEFGISPRCISKEKISVSKCFYTNKKTKQMVYFARAY